jgi:hypothetical protein
MANIVDNARMKEKEDSVQDQEIKKRARKREVKKESQRKGEVKRKRSNNPKYISST